MCVKISSGPFHDFQHVGNSAKHLKVIIRKHVVSCMLLHDFHDFLADFQAVFSSNDHSTLTSNNSMAGGLEFQNGVENGIKMDNNGMEAEICRICGKSREGPDEIFTHIFGPHGEKCKLQEKLKFCFTLQMRNNKK